MSVVVVVREKLHIKIKLNIIYIFAKKKREGLVIIGIWFKDGIQGRYYVVKGPEMPFIYQTSIRWSFFRT